MSNDLKQQNVKSAEDELSFIASSDGYDNLKVSPPKRWFNVCTALLIGVIGTSVGAIIGLVINFVVSK